MMRKKCVYVRIMCTHYLLREKTPQKNVNNARQQLALNGLKSSFPFGFQKQLNLHVVAGTAGYMWTIQPSEKQQSMCTSGFLFRAEGLAKCIQYSENKN